MSDSKMRPIEVVDRLERLYGTKENPKVTAVENIPELMRQGVKAITIVDLENDSSMVKEADNDAERLVDPNFVITEELVKERIRKACHEVYPGYPPVDARLRLRAEDAKKLAERARTGQLSIQAIYNGTNGIYFHPNREQNKEKFRLTDLSPKKGYLDDSKFKKSYAGKYAKFAENRPVNPDLDVMLEEGLVVGPGFYFEEGPNKAADAIFPCLVKGKDGNIKIYLLSASRSDVRQDAFLGGMVDPGELEEADQVPEKVVQVFQRVMEREMSEEMGGEFFDPQDLEYFIVYANRVADMRGNATSWAETLGSLVVSHKYNPLEAIARKQLTGSSEGGAGAMLATEQNLSKMFANHGDIALAGIKKYQELLSDILGFEVFVDKEGNLRRSTKNNTLLN